MAELLAKAGKVTHPSSPSFLYPFEPPVDSHPVDDPNLYQSYAIAVSTNPKWLPSSASYTSLWW